ncbi:HAD hydrolase-like protein [Ensifer adhaerens]|nr:HAD hydrolase-like protein [Ensifer adhaerens]UAY02371.1 HAD hydrolase-like protein [Ensifer adhaerens]UAY09751.1 HAD hydrolase-like protein [Ensifer adhaerens]
MMTYQFAIFDFDGTLADTAASFMAACNSAARCYGFRELSIAEFQSLRTMGNREIIAHLGVPVWKLPQIATFMRRAMAAEAASVRLFPGVAELLARLKAAGIGIAIVSSNAEEGIRAALGEVAAAVDLFECGAALFGKAQHFKKAIRYSGLNPARFLAIGDEARDIEAARKAGIAAGAVAWGYADPAFLQKLGPDRFFASVEEIAPAFGVN